MTAIVDHPPAAPEPMAFESLQLNNDAEGIGAWNRAAFVVKEPVAAHPHN
ncbi:MULTISPECIES: hypothetical protein [unclassified Sinorhizobium]